MNEEERYKKIDLARELIQHLEAENDEMATLIMDDLTRVRETELFHEVGQLTRNLHESLKSFEIDSDLQDVASAKIPDAKDRLNYVIKISEESAHKTLGIVEEKLPQAQNLQGKSQEMNERWAKFMGREMSVEEFRELSKELPEFMAEISKDSSDLYNSLQEILMAQGFQDLAGQTIKRVIALIQEIEDNLVEMVKLSGEKMKKLQSQGIDVVDDNGLHGPRVPGSKSSNGMVASQDEVDNLLDSLGF